MRELAHEAPKHSQEHGGWQNNPHNSDATRMQARIAFGIDTIKLQSLLKIEAFLAAGAFGNELGVWLEEPSVELRDGLIIISERMRVL